MRLEQIQAALRDEGLDGWLFFDHHRRDPLAYRVLQFTPGSMVTRRWFYYVPAVGEPRGLVHKIEAQTLAPLPGEAFLVRGLEHAGGRIEDAARRRPPRGHAVFAELRRAVCGDGGRGDGGTGARAGGGSRHARRI